MTAPWSPVFYIDIFGSMATMLLVSACTIYAWQWTRRKPDDIFRNYIFLLTVSIFCFAVSRSFGHLVKQILLLYGFSHTWKLISPFSGAINSATFIVIFAFGIYFQRFQKVHIEVENYKNNLELLVKERTTELAQTNIALENEITERSEAEEKIRQSKSTLENVLNSSNPLCITNTDYEIIQANESYYEIWDSPSDGEGPLKCFESRPGSHCHTNLCPIIQIKQGSNKVVIETSKSMRGNEHLEFIVTARPFRNADGELLGIVESFQDITKRKNAENSLAAERERLAVTLRSIGDGVITTDIDGNVLLINKAAEELTGWQQQEALGRPMAEVFNIVDRNSRQPLRDPSLEVISAGKIIDIPKEALLLTKNGKERIIADSGAPIRDVKSTIIGAVVVFRDVTEQVKMEKEFLKIKKLESVGILAGGIAHDFNNILVAILGNLDLASTFIDPESKPYRLIKNAQKASIRAADLTQQLLTFSRGGEPVKQTSSIDEIIRDSASFVLHGGNVSCTYDIPDDLRLVPIDKGQMSQVIQNIIINANQAMPDGGTIRITCTNVDSVAEDDFLLPDWKKYIKITITDSGCGIPAAIIDSIFDPYFSTRKAGSGLGLAITHSIIKKHGGHISASSSPGRGTTFTIYLPASEEQSVSADKKEMKIDDVGGGSRILVMDDEAMVRDVARSMLTTLGHEVLTVDKGEDAIRIFKELQKSDTPLELIIMDLTIPGGMGGKEAAEEILKLDPEARIIVSSGYSNDPVLADFREHGFCAVIVKPYILRELRKAVNQALQ